jgi:hypothetical protein
MALKNLNWKPPRMPLEGRIFIALYLGVPTLVIYGFLAGAAFGGDAFPRFLLSLFP